MDDVQNLLKKYNRITPVSREYWQHLSKMLIRVKRKNGQLLLRPGQIAKKVWYLISGFVIAFAKDANGNRVVMNIYAPGEVVTDLLSFLKEQPVNYTFMTIGNLRALQLTKKDYLKLTGFEETGKLVHALTLLKLQKDQHVQILSLLSSKQKVMRLLKCDRCASLPDKFCASLLRMPISKYMEFKVMLLRSGEIEQLAESSRQNGQSYEMQMAYEVKSYLLENYAEPDIGNLVKIADRFNTTKKTLSRHFKNNFAVTLPQLILKLRMEKAYQMLCLHKIPVKEVYQKVGYTDIYYFSRAFKKHFGFSAKEALKMPSKNFSV